MAKKPAPPPPPPKKGPKKNVSTRLPLDTIARIDRLTLALSRNAPKELEQADTIRLLLSQGLSTMEPANGIRPPPEAA